MSPTLARIWPNKIPLMEIMFKCTLLKNRSSFSSTFYTLADVDFNYLILIRLRFVILGMKQQNWTLMGFSAPLAWSEIFSPANSSEVLNTFELYTFMLQSILLSRNYNNFEDHVANNYVFNYSIGNLKQRKFKASAWCPPFWSSRDYSLKIKSYYRSKCS